ncbi:hypothetical protein SAMN05216366_104120 [Selenomonas ruminantium]|uniref:Uncharacterized protein n=1 Tax=Selenomonas ruminantium TaxID=971 RepID=A0A1H0P5C7_SELRU|nr:hypothetical protein SAMN05216366_104120 [Selenomonas ruminantium]
MKKLEPCDICGGRMRIIHKVFWWIECQECGRKTICAPPNTDARMACIERWNNLERDEK